MSEASSIRRIVVCADGAGDVADTESAHSKSRNFSSITRIKSAVKTGVCVDQHGNTSQQFVQYYSVVDSGSNFTGKFRKDYVDPIEQQIQEIVRNICQQLDGPQDEIFLYGSGRGAYIIRAVAGVLHHMGVPKSGSLGYFAELYKTAVDLYKARCDEDSMKGHRAIEFLRAHTNGVPNIQFVGIFDAIRTSADRQLHDTSVVSSIRNFRHAIAFNENRAAMALDMPQAPNLKEIEGRSFTQAWFLGVHQDIIGGTHEDGLSLYPLQWILIESMQNGLVLAGNKFEKPSTNEESPLSLIFPQYLGDVPRLGTNERIEWQLHYVNNITVSMFDLQSVQVSKLDAREASHNMHFTPVSAFYNSPRKIFNSNKGLVGWEALQGYGTVIHPSVFCILDRNPRYFETARFKYYKEQLAEFEINCLRGDTGEIPPWLEGSELLASGVKAFRILVCGKTGVGKSTLINKVFGVEMTEESNSYAQGQHDINKAFESPNHPGLLIHDSCGWQAGSDTELDLIAQFLRHRAFQKDPAEALHVIWFCVDADVSRIETADKRTFETIAQYSNHVPVFVVGTKKDKLVAFRQMKLLEHYMEQTNDYKESKRLANEEADKMAMEQFSALREQLSQIKDYKADGYLTDDDAGVKSLLTQTLDLIADERVRLFCVAAQVVDVDKKIDSAITECMRLGTHAIRTALVPLPFSGIIGTPTVSRILCEHVLQCFGFPKAMPEEVEEIMSRVVLGNLRQFMTVTVSQFMIVSGASVGLAMGTIGIGALLGLVSCFLSTPPTARMILKCACDMILILERSFRYSGKYVSVKQIEDAAKQYVTIETTTFSGKQKKLQEHVHDEVDRLVPLRKLSVGWQFKKLRTGFEYIVYKNRYDRPQGYEEIGPFTERVAELNSATIKPIPELSPEGTWRAELKGTSQVSEIDSYPRGSLPPVAELPGPPVVAAELPSRPLAHHPSEVSWETATTATTRSPGFSPVTLPSELSASSSLSVCDKSKLERIKSDSSGSNLFSRGWKSMKITKTKSAV